MRQFLAEQSRAEQSRAEQSRAEQSRAEQSRAEQSRAERNNYIDFFARNRIYRNHCDTAFWSGQSYTPEWFWNLTLLLDVPVFSIYLMGIKL